MEAYKEWRKMLYDVIKVNFKKLMTTNGKIEEGGNYIYIEDEFPEPYNIKGLCSFSTDRFSKFSPNAWASMTGTSMPSKTFRTYELSSKKETLDEILVAYSATGALFYKWTEFFEFTIEGIKIASAPEKTKFFMHDGYDYNKSSCVFSTYKKMAEDGFKADYNYIEIKSYPTKDGYLSAKDVTPEVKIYAPFKNYLPDTITRVMDLYNNNKNLYDEALDEICDKYEI